MKTGVLSLLLLLSVIPAVGKTYIIDTSSRYDSITGVGFDRIPTPKPGSYEPYYWSVRVPDGNYRVTFDLGSDHRAAETTVRAESRRLLVENQPTRKGEHLTRSFIVNKRTPRIDDATSIRLKPREYGKLDWDDRLTFEINGKAPALRSITIEPADTASTITLYLCGNSTVVDQENEPWASWGQMVTRFFDDHVAVANYAESGESANTFIAARRLRRALRDARPGDWMFVEFGHNDQKQKGPGKGAWYTFATSLKTIADEARAKGVNVVFVTPTRRRVFNSYGATVNTHEDFPDAMREVARRENIPVIELNGMTAGLYEAMGPNDSKRAFVHYPANSFPGQPEALEDNTHFNTYGAYQIAKCVIEGLRDAAPGLYSHVIDFSGYNPSQPDEFSEFYWAPSPFCETVKPDGN